jgi:hypothetical protein
LPAALAGTPQARMPALPGIFIADITKLEDSVCLVFV